MPYDEFGNPVTYEELAEQRYNAKRWKWFIAGSIVGFVLCLAIVL